MSDKNPVLSIVTPWKDHPDLIEGYHDALITSPEPLEVIIVDNASGPETARKLIELVRQFNETEVHSAKLIINSKNNFFALASNQGYAQSTATAICFLNSDVEPLQTEGFAEHWTSVLLDRMAADALESAPDSLYGTEIIHKGVTIPRSRRNRRAVRIMLPYVSGWCIIGTRTIWDKLKQRRWGGPWNQKVFTHPYWEDNELCFRATQLGVKLVQVNVKLKHLGGVTARGTKEGLDHYCPNKAALVKMILEAYSSNNLKPIVVEQHGEPYYVME
jgi:GT2 family glycosyltransferase